MLAFSLAALPVGVGALDLRVTPAMIDDVSFVDAQVDGPRAGITQLDPITVYPLEFVDGLGGLDLKLKRAIPCIGTCSDSGRRPLSRIAGVLTRLFLGDAPAEPAPTDVRLQIDVWRAVTRADKLP